MPSLRALTEKLRWEFEAEEAPAAVGDQPKVGDILYSSWGYDQTNIDFYKVLAVTKASVKIAEIPSRVVADNGPSVSVMPDTNAAPTGKVMTKRFRTDTWHGRSEGYRVKISDYATAHLWDGKPKSQTGAGYGH